MKQVWIPRAGAPEVLELREAADPTPGPGQVRIRVEAAGVNFADVMGRLGIYADLPPMPVVPGYEVGGRIDAVGAGVDATWVGKDVLSLTRFGGPLAPKELAALLGIGSRTLRRMLLGGLLPEPIRASKRAMWWPRDLIKNWMDSGGHIQARTTLHMRRGKRSL